MQPLISYNEIDKWMWFRTPKTAHSSLKVILERTEGYVHNDVKIDWNAEHASHYEDWFKFSVVREPLERFESMWKWLCVKKDKFRIGEARFDINNCVDHIINSKNIHTIPLADLIPESVNFILAYKNLHEDFMSLADKLQLNITMLPYVNVSPQIHSQVNRRNMQKIVKYYSEDYKRFYKYF